MREWCVSAALMLARAPAWRRAGHAAVHKVAHGVQVALIYDGLGSFGTGTAYLDRLAKVSVAVCKFKPVNPLARPSSWGSITATTANFSWSTKRWP